VHVVVLHGEGNKGVGERWDPPISAAGEWVPVAWVAGGLHGPTGLVSARKGNKISNSSNFFKRT
jgi:hypothetical protein